METDESFPPSAGPAFSKLRATQPAPEQLCFPRSSKPAGRGRSLNCDLIMALSRARQANDPVFTSTSSRFLFSSQTGGGKAAAVS